MPLNKPEPVSVGRQPRGMAFANGIALQGVVSFEVDNNSYYMADTFRITLALSAQPKETNFQWWSTQTDLLVELLAGFPADPDHPVRAELASLIIGNVDEIDIDPVADEINLSGRDLTSQFIETKTTEKFQNLTSSQIAQKLAVRRGLTAVVVPTKTQAGRYYQIDHAKLNSEHSEWDLLTYLAREEDYSVFVKGKVLYFQPRTKPSDNPYVIKWQAPTDSFASPQMNAQRIRFSRNLNLAKDVVVYVHSWNLKQKKGFTVKAQAKHIFNKTLKGAATPYRTAQTYHRTYPGLTQQEAQNRAYALLHEITQHEVNIHAEMPADNILSTENIIQVIGTATAYDQIYYPASIVRHFSMDEGYHMTIEAKNHAVESEASV